MSNQPPAITERPGGHLVPALIAAAGDQAAGRYIDFCTAICKLNSHQPYARACSMFFTWCDERGLNLQTIRPYHVSQYLEDCQQTHLAPDVRQQLVAIRTLFDWLVTGQVIPVNPAATVRWTTHTVKTDETPVLGGKEWCALLDSMPTTMVRDLRDRALIATLTYSFVRIRAALTMKIDDLVPQAAGWQIQLHENGGKHAVIPCHHVLAEALRAYIDAAGIAEDRKGWLFRTSRGPPGSNLSDQPMTQSDVWRMIRRRALAGGIRVPISDYSFYTTVLVVDKVGPLSIPKSNWWS